ncbi:MAG: DMT family transporter [Firmicutes bacterium]|jgi:transporter family-2 protein|nr:DMT family transporter [Bacillota bacterium]
MNYFLSVISGTLISIMVLCNGTLSRFIGNSGSSVIIHIVGLITMILVLIISKKKVFFDKSIPLYLYSAGAIGVVTVIFNNISFSKLGISIPLALGLLGQSLASIIIDHYGIMGMKKTRFNSKKLIGLSIISLGVIVMMF